MTLRSAILAILIGIGELLTPHQAGAQYLYLDTDGDGVPTTADRVGIPGTTNVGVWLRTDVNRDGSAAPCGGSGTMTLTSYEFTLRAENGTLKWGSYVNAQASTMTVSFGSSSTPTEFYVGYGGSTALSPGTYLLGTVPMLVTSGSPTIAIASDSTGSHRTSFGSGCSGSLGNNTLMLGQDWLDADGLAAAAATVRFFEDFENTGGTFPWSTTSTSSVYWGLSTSQSPACGYAVGKYAASATNGFPFCSSYPSDLNNSTKPTTVTNASRLHHYRVAFDTRRKLNTNFSDRLWSGYLLGTNPAILSASGVASRYGEADTWTSVVGDSIDNSDDFFMQNPYVQPIFGCQTTAASPGTGTYGVWIDNVQIYGTQRADLVISSVSPPIAYGPDGTKNSLVSGSGWTLKFTVRNAGQLPSSAFSMNSFRVAAWLKDAGGSLFTVGDTIQSGLAAGTQRTVTWQRPASSNWPPTGSYTLVLKADSDNSVVESTSEDEPEQNTYSTSGTAGTFNWTPPPVPDLAILPISSPPVAKTGKPIGVTVVVKNVGTADISGSFRLGWYRNPTTAPPVNTVPDSFVTITGLAKGQTGTYTFFTTNNYAQTWTAYAFVDYQNAVSTESSEGNNVSPGIALTWAPKTLIVRGVFQYPDSVWGGVTSTYCNDIMLLDWDSPTNEDTLATGVAAQWATNTFEFPAIANDDGDDNHGLLDLFVRVNYRSNEACWASPWPDNWCVSIRTPSDSLWHYDSAVYPDYTTSYDADTLNIILEPQDYAHRGAGHLFKVFTQRGWGLIRNNTPATTAIPEVRVRWAPGFSHPTGLDPDSNVIYVNGTDNLNGYYPDEWDDAVLLHEYAHYVARYDSIEVQGPNRVGPHVQWGSSAYDSLAWGEGWADFFGALRGDDPYTSDYGVYSDYGRGSNGARSRIFMRLEDDTVIVYKPDLNTVQRDTTLFGRGDVWEGSIAASLWDLYDTHDDLSDGLRPTALGDSISEGFSGVFGVLTRAPRAPTGTVHDVLGRYESKYADAKSPQFDVGKATLIRRVFLDHGIYAGRDSFYLTGVEEQGVGGHLRILGASPNPFNPLVRIRFYVDDVGRTSKVHLRIYDVHGRLVRTLRPGALVRGTNEVYWDGRSDSGGSAASGMYFCELGDERVRGRTKLTMLK